VSEARSGGSDGAASTGGDEVAISAVGLRRSFGRVRALDGMDLEVRTGEILGLIGPNGAGKSTFIRVVAGLLNVDDGTVRVLGETPGRRVAADIGYMTQAAALYEDLSVRENLSFFGRVYGLTKDRARERGDELLTMLRIQVKAESPVRELSGGQRQLANLACAMVHAPRLLLLDEPTVGIDPELRRELWTEFGTLRALGTTILVTTHVMDEADRCDRVAFVAEGRVLDVGAPDELRARGGVSSIEEAFLRLRGGEGS